MKKLDKKFKKAWVKALLSGEFEQNFVYGFGKPGCHCVLQIGSIIKFKTSSKWASVLGNGDDYDSVLATEELWKLNDHEQLPFEIFAGIIQEWL